MESRAYTIAGLALALAGPGVIALLSMRLVAGSGTLAANLLWLGVFALLIATVALVAVVGEKLTWSDVGFANVSWHSIPSAILMTLFFILVFSPLAYWALAKLELGSFETGIEPLQKLPAWSLCLTVLVVAGGEEWLYRGYAIERLEDLTGNTWLAAAISLAAFALAHLPAWGLGPSLTTLFSGGILTVLYCLRRDILFLILAHVATDLYGLVLAR